MTTSSASSSTASSSSSSTGTDSFFDFWMKMGKVMNSEYLGLGETETGTTSVNVFFHTSDGV